MEDISAQLSTYMPPITSKERMFVRAFNGDVIYALKLAGYTGEDTYLIDLGRKLLMRYEIQAAIKENIAKGEKKESAILSKVERMEILSGIARNADPYHTMTKDDYGREVVKDPPTVSERIKSIDILNKMEGEYQSTVNVKHEFTLQEMVLQSYKEDITPVEVIEAEYLELRKAENSAPIEPEKTEQTEPTEELFI